MRGKQTGLRLPGSIWALGFVSLFMDISSEMIHALLPVFLATVLGASTVTIGLIEGLGEGMASFAKLFSGWLSDRLGRRKMLTLLGYGIGALSKPLFALAPSPSWVLAARLSDRIGKGIRGAPRDALIGDLAPSSLWGAAYGLRQSLDTVGAFLGPLLAMALMALTANDFRLVFWIAVIPGLLCVATLWFGVKEPERETSQKKAEVPIHWRDLAGLGRGFWAVVAVAGVLTLARFSEAFLILRAEERGLSLALVPMVLIVMNIVYALTAYPVGVWADRTDKRVILAAGFGVLVMADLVLALASNLWGVMLGTCLWGLHMGMTQGLLATFVAASVPAVRRGSAFGLYHLVIGVALLFASLIAGTLWEWLGPAATFLGGAVLTMLGLVGSVILLRRR